MEYKKYAMDIRTVDGNQFTVYGNDYEYTSGIHYLNGSSYPDLIVKEVRLNEGQ